MPGYRAVLFDFFGTLTQAVRRGSGHRDVAEALGCELAALIDVLDRSYYRRASGALGDAEATLRWVGEQAGARPSDAAVRAARLARERAVQADIQLRPDAVRALRELRPLGVRTAVVSDCTHELPVLLPRLPVAPLLDAQVFSVEVRRCKPAPEIFLAACRQLAVAPSDCLYVGDGGSRELTGATAAGLTAVRLVAPDLDDHLVFDSESTWSGAVIEALGEVPALAAGRPAPALV